MSRCAKPGSRRSRGAILEPGLPIVDAHHHLWDRPGARYLFERIPRRHALGPRHPRRRSSCSAVRCSGHSGAGGVRPVGETSSSPASLRGVPAAFTVPCAPAPASSPGGPDARATVAPVLEAHLLAAGGRLRGIRNSTAWHARAAVRSNPITPPPGLLLRAGLRRGAAAAGALGPRWMSGPTTPNSTRSSTLPALSPTVTVVLDHCRRPARHRAFRGGRDEVFASWRTGC